MTEIIYTKYQSEQMQEGYANAILSCDGSGFSLIRGDRDVVLGNGIIKKRVGILHLQKCVIVHCSGQGDRTQQRGKAVLMQ